jgi:hypothetical protein
MPRPSKSQPLHQRQSKTLTSKQQLRAVTLQLPPAHSKEQYQLIHAFEIFPGCRFVVGACGTKFGKTYACTIRLVKEAWDNKNTLNWWVAPSYAQSKMAYAMVKKLLPKDSYEEYKADLTLVLLEPDGSEHSTIVFKSGDNPDSLRGFRVHFAVIDEAARVPYESFVSVMTTLTETRGRAIIISTPKNRGWFYDVYQRGVKFASDGSPLYVDGVKDQWPEWFSLRLPTWINPHVQIESIQEMRRNLPEQVFRQEVAAVFLLDSAGVFQNIRACVTAGHFIEPPLPGRAYVLGVDLARIEDYTVLTVIDRVRKHVVYWARFNEVSWQIQYYRIMEIARMYNNALIAVDGTGLGDPICDTLSAAGFNVEGYKISGTSKTPLIEKLRLNIEQVRITYPHIPILIDELERYEYIVTERGNIQYSAPQGKHDDCVISLALANWYADQPLWRYRAHNVRGV